MTEKQVSDGIDISALRADPDVLDVKDINGIEFGFMTMLPAKAIRDLDMNPDTNLNWEFDLMNTVVKYPVLSYEDVYGDDDGVGGMSAKAFAEVIVECLDIAGLNVRPTFR